MIKTGVYSYIYIKNIYLCVTISVLNRSLIILNKKIFQLQTFNLYLK